MLRTAFISLFLLLFASCGTIFPAADGSAPRVSTAQERASVEPYVMAAEDVLATAFALHGITQQQLDLGTAVIAQFRKDVAASETVPVDWPGVLRKAMRLTVIVLTSAREPAKAAAPPTPPK